MAKKKSLIYDIFVGEFVGIITNVFVKQLEQTEDQIKEINEPLMFEGFLLETDELYYYIGIDPTQVTHAIKKDVVVSINILQIRTTADEVMDNILERVPTPGKKEGYN